MNEVFGEKQFGVGTGPFGSIKKIIKLMKKESTFEKRISFL
jgi:hypothetical protein